MKRLTRPQIIAIVVGVVVIIYALIRFSKLQKEKRYGNLPDCSIWDRAFQVFGGPSCEEKTREAIDWQKSVDDALKESQNAGIEGNYDETFWRQKANQVHEATKGSAVISDVWITTEGTSSKSEYLLWIASHVQNDTDWLTFSRVYGIRQNCKYLINCSDLDLPTTLSKEMKSKEKNALNSLYYSRGIRYTI